MAARHWEVIWESLFHSPFNMRPWLATFGVPLLVCDLLWKVSQPVISQQCQILMTLHFLTWFVCMTVFVECYLPQHHIVSYEVQESAALLFRVSVKTYCDVVWRLVLH